MEIRIEEKKNVADLKNILNTMSTIMPQNCIIKEIEGDIVFYVKDVAEISVCTAYIKQSSEYVEIDAEEEEAYALNTENLYKSIHRLYKSGSESLTIEIDDDNSSTVVSDNESNGRIELDLYQYNVVNEEMDDSMIDSIEDVKSNLSIKISMGRKEFKDLGESMKTFKDEVAVKFTREDGNIVCFTKEGPKVYREIDNKDILSHGDNKNFETLIGSQHIGRNFTNIKGSDEAVVWLEHDMPMAIEQESDAFKTQSVIAPLIEE